MIRLKPRLDVLASVSFCVLLLGCPGGGAGGGGAPVLELGATSVSIGAVSLQGSVSIRNTGGGSLGWTAREVRRPAGGGDWSTWDSESLTLESEDGLVTGAEVSGVVTGVDGRVVVRLIADAPPLDPAYEYGVQVASNGGTATARILVSSAVVSINPLNISLDSQTSSATFTILNPTSDPVDWSLAVVDPDDLTPIATPSYIVNLPLPATVPAAGQQENTLVISRSGLLEGIERFALEVTLPSGPVIVQISFSVGDAVVFDAVLDPVTINVNSFGTGEEVIAELTISNGGAEELDWALTFEDPETGLPVQTDYLIFSAITGTVPPRTENVISTDVVTIEVLVDSVPEEGREVRIVVTAGGVGTRTVQLSVRRADGPRLTIRQLPALRTDGILDFGTDLDVMTLGVGNTGVDGSQLSFALTTDRPDLITISDPTFATSVGVGRCQVDFEDDFFDCFDWHDFEIVIVRSAMRPGESDGGDIIITPTGDASGLDEIVVSVNVTRAPLRIEGAMNRARPPFLQRFVFLLRDSLLNSVDVTNPDTFRTVSFSISENGLPLELDETSMFLQGPEGLRHNVVLLLDFTGSMYHAGEDDGLGNGVLLESIKSRAMDFVQHLPASFRLSVMEHHERDQTQRVIHPFSLDRDLIEAALDDFSLSSGVHGASDGYDALLDAVDALVDQDPTALPFDDADVRSLIYVSDGNDTSSEISLSSLTADAQSVRVRIYPVILGDSPDLASMIKLGNETGGHGFPVTPSQSLGVTLGTVGSEGVIWEDLQRQVMLTYVTLLDVSSEYLITGRYIEPSGQEAFGTFERDGVFFAGDARAGQITLLTEGIDELGWAEVFVRADYVPRDISQFRFRFIIPRDFQDNLVGVDLLPSSSDAGLLSHWQLIDEGDHAYTVVTSVENPTDYGAFGNLLRLTFSGLQPTVDDTEGDRFQMGFRLDNTLYTRRDPASSVNTKYFLYPGGPSNPSGILTVESRPDLAPPATSVVDLLDTDFDPDAPMAFDRDGDSLLDFEDPFPDNEDLPASIVVPGQFLFAVSGGVADPQTFAIRNNRLSTMIWSFSRAGLDPFTFSAPLAAPETFTITDSLVDGTLAPGDKIAITMDLDEAQAVADTVYSVDVQTNLDPVPTMLRVVVQVLAR